MLNHRRRVGRSIPAKTSSHNDRALVLFQPPRDSCHSSTFKMRASVVCALMLRTHSRRASWSKLLLFFSCSRVPGFLSFSTRNIPLRLAAPRRPPPSEQVNNKGAMVLTLGPLGGYVHTIFRQSHENFIRCTCWQALMRAPADVRRM